MIRFLKRLFRRDTAVARCQECRGEGWLMHSEGEPCEKCVARPGHQVGGSGWLRGGKPMTIEEARILRHELRLVGK